MMILSVEKALLVSRPMLYRTITINRDKTFVYAMWLLFLVFYGCIYFTVLPSKPPPGVPLIYLGKVQDGNHCYRSCLIWYLLRVWFYDTVRSDTTRYKEREPGFFYVFQRRAQPDVKLYHFNMIFLEREIDLNLFLWKMKLFSSSFKRTISRF